MSSIVLDLQNEVTKPDCDIVSVLRKAHLIAIKLGLTDFDKWILCELNGYQNNDKVPDYRKIRGLLKALNPYRGWIPTAMYDEELENEICRISVRNSVSEIISLYSQKQELGVEFTGEKLMFINSLFASPSPLKYAVHLSPTAIIDIVEKVKTALLEWTIKLESEGILGEGMIFDTTEKETAKTIPQTINNYYGNTSVINAPVEGSVIATGNDNTVEFTYEKAENAVSEIESAIEKEDISAENKETAIEMLTEIKEKINAQKKPSIIKSALVGLKDFLIGAGASAAVAIIQAKMQGLF